MSVITAKKRVWDQLRQIDTRCFARLLPLELLQRAAQQAQVRWGRGPLHVPNLIWLGLCAVQQPHKNFANLLVWVLHLLEDRPQAGQRPQQSVTEEAFVQARRKLTTAFWNALLDTLFLRFEALFPQHVRWKEFRLLALDGTTISLPHWRWLRAHFGAAKNGRGQMRTQARLVLLQSPKSRLPWRYELTPLAEGERTVARRLVAHLQRNDLILIDRGLWSYGLFWQIQERQAFFAIRKVKQVKWRVLRRLDRGDYLVRHRPRDRRQQWGDLPDSIDLRYIPYQLAGFRPSGIVTNVLEPERISREEWVRLAAVDEAGRVLEPGLYHRRWEIETTFRELKVTQGLEGGLRSRRPAGIAYEVGAQLLFYQLLRWLIVEAAEEAGLPDPLRVSFRGALEELADMRPSLLFATPSFTATALLPRLRARIASHLVPPRPGRHYARPRDGKLKNKGNGRHQQPSKQNRKVA